MIDGEYNSNSNVNEHVRTNGVGWNTSNEYML